MTIPSDAELYEERLVQVAVSGGSEELLALPARDLLRVLKGQHAMSSLMLGLAVKIAAGVQPGGAK